RVGRVRALERVVASGQDGPETVLRQRAVPERGPGRVEIEDLGVPDGVTATEPILVAPPAPTEGFEQFGQPVVRLGGFPRVWVKIARGDGDRRDSRVEGALAEGGRGPAGIIDDEASGVTEPSLGVSSPSQQLAVYFIPVFLFGHVWPS